MSVEIVHTTQGLFLEIDGELTAISPAENATIWVALDEDPELGARVKAEILSKFSEYANDSAEKFDNFGMFNTNSLLTYIESMHQWWTVGMVGYAQYRTQIESARNQ